MKHKTQKTKKLTRKRSNIIRRHYPTLPCVGVGVVVWCEEKILIIKRGHPPHLNEWSLPGGLQKLGETIFDAAQREVKEETGINVTALNLITVVDSIHRDKSGVVEYHYSIVEVFAETNEKTIAPKDDVVSAKWVRIDEINKYCNNLEIDRVVRLSALQKFL